MNQYFYIAFVYFNGVISPFEFRIIKNTTLMDMKSKLENVLRYNGKLRVVNVVYHSTMFDFQGNIRFSKFEFNMKDNVRVMGSTFHRCETKGPIEVDAHLKDRHMIL